MRVKWTVVVLMAVLILAIVHCDNRATAAIAMTILAIGVWTFASRILSFPEEGVVIESNASGFSYHPVGMSKHKTKCSCGP